MANCDFCRKIKTLWEPARDGSFSGIIKDRDTYYLYENSGHSWYSEACFEDIKYCPYCGRILSQLPRTKFEACENSSFAVETNLVD